MKTAAFAVLTLSGAGLFIMLARIAIVTLQPDPGLANPNVHIELRPGTSVYLLAAVLWMGVAFYLYAVVIWTDWRLESTRPAETPREGYWQPLEVQWLKAAIRAGDVDAVRHSAGEAAWSYRDESVLTPYELADLYGNPEVMAAVSDAFRQHAGRLPQEGSALPPNRFATAPQFGERGVNR